METNYDIEFDITSILNQILYGSGNNERTERERETAEPANTRSDQPDHQPIDSNANRFSDISGTWISMMHTNQSIIDNLIYSYNNQMQIYNHNMERYHQNIERIIQLVLSSQTQIQQRIHSLESTNNTARGTPPPTYAGSNVFGANTIYSQRRNAVRNEGNLIRLLLNTTHYGTNRNTANMLYTYLYPNLQNSTTIGRNLLTPVQRANAIQVITYNQDIRSTTADHVCPISLLSFQQGEQVSQIKYCMHIFKTEYLNNWLTNYSTCCPVCRYDLRSYSVDNTNRNNHNNNHTHNDHNNSETDETESETNE